VPFNIVHNTHVDFNYSWSGNQNPQDIFEFKEQLGKGAFGQVVKAIHKESGFELAVKVVPSSRERRQALEKEIEVLKKCKSPNILSYYGTVSTENELWILMDCCSVGSVRDMMRSALTTLNEEQIGYICLHSLKGLAYLHSVNILHLDVKSANILITKEGQVKLGDFGVSEEIQRASIMIKPTDFVGSPLWMAPEIITKDNHTNKADIWSLGITVIEMAEGKPPNTDINNLQKLLQLPLRPPPKLQQQHLWSLEMKGFLETCVMKEPEQRPSAIELLMHPFIQTAQLNLHRDVIGPIIRQSLGMQAKKQLEQLSGMY